MSDKFNLIYRFIAANGMMSHRWFMGWHGDTSDPRSYAERYHSDRAKAGVFTQDEVDEHLRLFDQLHVRRDRVPDPEERMALIPAPVGVMSALELRQAQHRLQLSDADLAASLTCSAQHVRRMKVIDTSLPSHRPVSPAYEKLINAMLSGAIAPVRIKG